MKILHSIEKDTKRLFKKIKDKGLFADNICKKIYPSGTKRVTIYGLRKTHKLLSNYFQNLSFRSIASSIATYNYNLATFLSELLNPVIWNECCATDSFTFCEEIQGLSANDCFLVLYEAWNVITSITLTKTIVIITGEIAKTIAVELVFQNKGDLKASKNQLKQCFNWQPLVLICSLKVIFNDQIDGVSMGSPLGHVFANLFMGCY